MGDHCNPIIGLHDSIALNLLSVNVPFTDRWTDKSYSLRTDNIDVEEIGEEKLTCDFILKKYQTFTGIGHFKCAPDEIKLKDNAVPVQKPLRRIPVAMRDEFQEEINSMVKTGILTKLDKNQATECRLSTRLCEKKGFFKRFDFQKKRFLQQKKRFSVPNG